MFAILRLTGLSLTFFLIDFAPYFGHQGLATLVLTKKKWIFLVFLLPTEVQRAIECNNNNNNRWLNRSYQGRATRSAVHKNLFLIKQINNCFRSKRQWHTEPNQHQKSLQPLNMFFTSRHQDLTFILNCNTSLSPQMSQEEDFKGPA